MCFFVKFEENPILKLRLTYASTYDKNCCMQSYDNESCIVRQAAYTNAWVASLGSQSDLGMGNVSASWQVYVERAAEIRGIQDKTCATCPKPDNHEETKQVWAPELRHPLRTVTEPVIVWDCSQHVLPSTR